MFSMKKTSQAMPQKKPAATAIENILADFAAENDTESVVGYN